MTPTIPDTVVNTDRARRQLDRHADAHAEWTVTHDRARGREQLTCDVCAIVLLDAAV